MSFKSIQKLNVERTLTTGETVSVGILAQNRQGVFFQYDEIYLSRFGNLSPFTLQGDVRLQQAPKGPHQGIHGVFGDSLPDGWGLLLQDRVFRQQGILPAQVTAMDRLAFVGQQGMGALSFTPVSELSLDQPSDIDLETLGLEAQTLFDQSLSDELNGSTAQVLATLVAVGSSGGARPKAQIYIPAGDATQCRTYAQPGDEAWLVKFTSKNLALGHEEGLCEAVYLQMAEQAKCQPPMWQLIEAPASSGAKAWLALKRFDYLPAQDKVGRLHMHSACGLLDADFRSPSLDYSDLIKASRQLCKSPAAGQLQFRRAMFNLFAANQDDHSKNWGFLQADDGSWQLAPFYDVTFSPHPFNEHSTAFAGYGKTPPLKVMQKLAASAGFANWKEAQQCIKEVVDAIGQFKPLAEERGVSKTTVSAIAKTLAERKQENAVLLA
ncbi:MULTISPECIES: type II toxin-antitoxin system HipA family toxin [Vibrio]|uniref:type II toxin-antitoxin system HipA family toxin n=1 Tax=Vibrio TaxID=662 RepID=UPI000C8617CE|nr:MULTISPECIES: type II toxin-antitoxin system HipA family toxin [Vibrio]PMG67314.1 phosphatidylinositol kinase [Vibrio lentus]TKE93751.1 type II toxin-antitoxin system HipA family toxin [Vibrio sp. F12]